MKSKILVMILILAIVLFSGCTDMDWPVGGKYCSEIGLCEDTDIKEVEIPDVITIKEIKFLPITGNRVKPNTTLDVIVTLENRDEDKPVTLEDVRINPGIFSCDCKEGCKCSYTNKKMNPGQIKSFSFKIKSPLNEGTIAMEGQLSVSVKYNYSSSRIATITFTNRDTVKEYIEGGKKIPVHISNVPSDGPVDLYLDISKIQQPVILENEGPYNIYLEIRNKGRGEVEEIKKNELEIELEGMVFDDCSKEFGGDTCAGKNSTKNSGEEITIRGTNPKKYYFGIKPKEGWEKISPGQLTEVKTITAKASYTYRISESRNLIVSPRAQI